MCRPVQHCGLFIFVFLIAFRERITNKETDKDLSVNTNNLRGGDFHWSAMLVIIKSWN